MARSDLSGPAAELDPAHCPCRREGKGCINYSVIATDPFYICRFTDERAFVPTEGETGGYEGMYG